MNDIIETFKKIEEFNTGETVTGFYIVRKSELKTRKNGAPYLHLNLADATGRISGNAWDNAREIYNAISPGDIVKVRAAVQTFNDALQLSVNKIRKAEKIDQVNKEDFLPRGDFDLNLLVRQLDTLVKSVTHPDLSRLLALFFQTSDNREAFINAPAGKLWHHAYLNGLLEHTLSVARICDTMAELYPMVQRDLLISGALLHDIGKLDEYHSDPGYIEFTDQGRFWGHIVMGAQRVQREIEKMEEVSGFSGEIKKQLIHLILSHQGQLEHGSPVLPSTLEAMILYYADEMDSKANALKHIIQRDKAPGRRWSQYINMLNRFIYLGGDESQEIQETLFD